jgi:hypothetical protein
MFGETLTTLKPCLRLSDHSTVIRAIPNTTCSDKIPESELVDYSFNSCGHRAAIECGPKLPGIYRIVVVGSSFGFGVYVRNEQSFASLLQAELSQGTGRRIEVYNESMLGGWPRSVALRMDEVFTAKPDMILWALTPGDLLATPAMLPSDFDGPLPDTVVQSGFFAKRWYRVRAAFVNHSVPDAIAGLWRFAVSKWRTSSTAVLLQHIVLASRRQYVDAYLRGPDSEVGFLRISPSAEWRNNMKAFDYNAAVIEGRARAEGVPLVAALLPTRAQASMISMGVWPKGFDPFHVVHELRAIIVRHGGTYVDILPDFRGIRNPEQGYMQVDGHPNAQGHAMLSQLLAKVLTNGAIPDLEAAGI